MMIKSTAVFVCVVVTLLANVDMLKASTSGKNLQTFKEIKRGDFRISFSLPSEIEDVVVYPEGEEPIHEDGDSLIGEFTFDTPKGFFVKYPPMVGISLSLVSTGSVSRAYILDEERKADRQFKRPGAWACYDVDDTDGKFRFLRRICRLDFSQDYFLVVAATFKPWKKVSEARKQHWSDVYLRFLDSIKVWDNTSN